METRQFSSEESKGSVNLYSRRRKTVKGFITTNTKQHLKDKLEKLSIYSETSIVILSGYVVVRAILTSAGQHTKQATVEFVMPLYVLHISNLLSVTSKTINLNSNHKQK